MLIVEHPLVMSKRQNHLWVSDDDVHRFVGKRFKDNDHMSHFICMDEKFINFIYEYFKLIWINFQVNVGV